MPLILFPRCSMNPRKVDFAFDREWRAAKVAGFQVALFDDLHLDLKGVPEGNGETAIYRGWMLSTERYALLYHAMWKRGWHLINEPDEYRYCHELPSWYNDFVEATPRSVWFTSTDPKSHMNHIVKEVRKELGEGPYVVKDFVKSRKHEWDEACFIEGPDDIERITGTFIHRQGTDLAGGLVFRKFQTFKPVGKHATSGMPLIKEARYFVVRGHTLACMAYWGPNEGGADIELPGLGTGSDYGLGSNHAKLIKSNFFTMDVAELPTTLGGGWIIIELGDGQVAGLPEHVDAEVFYRSLKARFL